MGNSPDMIFGSIGTFSTCWGMSFEDVKKGFHRDFNFMHTKKYIENLIDILYWCTLFNDIIQFIRRMGVVYT